MGVITYSNKLYYVNRPAFYRSVNVMEGLLLYNLSFQANYNFT